MKAGTAVVVGATGALGGAIAARLRTAGLTVIAVSRGGLPPGDVPSGGREGSGEGEHACRADIASDDAVDTITRAVEEAGGPVRMVVQAAGLPASGPVTTVAPDALGAAVALKVGGLLRLVRAVDAADSALVAGSRIVALGGHYGAEPSPHTSGAGVTNAALANLVRQLADAYGPRGITAHLVAPGPADTDRLRRLSATQAEARGVDVESVLDERRAESPLGRLVTPAEVAWAVATLLDPEADALTGSTLALDVGARRGV